MVSTLITSGNNSEWDAECVMISMIHGLQIHLPLAESRFKAGGVFRDTFRFVYDALNGPPHGFVVVK